jgi:hypothetical protein
MRHEVPAHRKPRAPWIIVASLLQLTLTSVGHAHDAHAALEVEDQSQCISTTELTERVETILGRAAFNDPAAFTIAVTADDARVEIRFLDGDGQIAAHRTIDAADLSCEDRLGATAVIIAVLFDAPETEVILHVERTVLELPAPEPEPAPISTASSVGVFFGASGVAAYDWLPEIAAGARLSGGLVLDDWAFGLGVEVFPSGKLDARPGADFLTISGSLEGAVTLARFDVLAFSLTFRVAAGVMQGIGRNADRIYERLEPTLRADLGARLSIAVVGPLYFTMEIAGAATIIRPSFQARIADTQVVLYEPAWVHPALSAGFVLATD